MKVRFLPGPPNEEKKKMREFNLSPEEVIEVCRLAYNTSIPMGMGIYQFVPGDMSIQEAKNLFGPMEKSGHIHLDYIKGRMVKLYMNRNRDGSWSFLPENLSPDYQSWSKKFPSFKDLVDEAKQLSQRT